MRRTSYLRDMRGRVVKAPQYTPKPTADQNPEGKAAKRRRKQMERQLQKQVGPIELVPLPPDDPYVPPVVVESNPTNGPGLAQRLFVNRLVDNATLTHLLSARPDDPAAFARPVEAGTVSVGIDPARPEGDVTTVALRKGNEVLILDEASQVPQHMWDELGADVSRRIDEHIAAELGGGRRPPMNRARAMAKSGARHSLVLAAFLAATMGTDKPKE